ncbi:hypothetical protein L6R50_12315 [Myxococcota bacterium]|nr:hypothetical protein [Myxococcota bacterium]
MSSRPAPLALAFLLAAAAACTEDPAPDDDTAAPDDDTAPETPWEGVEVTLDPFSLRFGAAEIPAGGVVFGIEPTYDAAANHDPWILYGEGLQEFIPRLTWATAERGSWDGDALRLDLSDGHRGVLTRRGGGEGLALHLELEGNPGETGDAVASFLRVQVTSPEGEGLYGLGEVFESVEHRGRLRTMQHELLPESEGGYNETHVPVPFLVGSGGWGLGLETDWPAVFDCAAVEPGRVTATVNAPYGLDLRLFSDPDPAEIPGQWARSTALPRRPPDWALAPMLWRNENRDGAQVLEDARAIRDHDLAFGVMWIDNPWQSSYNSMQPDPAMFPDWEGMVDDLHALGFRWMAWTTPYVHPDDPDYATFEEEGWFADIPYTFGEFGPLVDLTHEGAFAAWQDRVRAAAARGLQGWKLDYGEDVQLGLGGIRLVSSFANGEDERTMHHRYTEYFHRAYGEAYPDGDRFLLGRMGTWGTAAFTDCIWPGDLDADFYDFLEEGHVGGLPAAVRGGIGLAVSGFPCFASDTGGYRHERARHEVLSRWTEYSALMPVMQVGGGDDHNYWIPSGDWTEETLEIGRRYSILHLRLFPFFQELLARAARDGTPPLLPPGLLGGPHVDDAYVLGRAVLVAPVIEEGVTSRRVEFPPGTWVHWWTGLAYQGEADVPAPVGEGPLFVGEGGIVPMLRESVRTVAPSTAGVDSFSDDPGELTVRFVPGEGAFTVLDGPGISGSDSSLEIGMPGIYTGLRVEIWAPGASRLRVDGAEVPAETDGTWLRGQVDPGTVTWE